MEVYVNLEVIRMHADSACSLSSVINLYLPYLVEVTVVVSDGRITTSEIRGSAGMKPLSLETGINC